MDALQELAKGVGCAADGAAARNPMAQFINGAMAGPVAGMPGQQMNPAMMAAQRARATRWLRCEARPSARP